MKRNTRLSDFGSASGGDLEGRRVDSFSLGDLSALQRRLLAVDIYGPDDDPTPRLLPRLGPVYVHRLECFPLLHAQKTLMPQWRASGYSATA